MWFFKDDYNLTLFEKLKLKNGLQSDFFEQYDNDRNEAIKWWESKRPDLLYGWARQAIDDAKNFYLIKKIYLADLIDEKAWSAIQSLYSLLSTTSTTIRKEKQSEARGKTLDKADYAHLDKLEKGNIIKSVRQGKYKRFYPIPMIPQNAERILNIIRENPGITQNEISKLTKISQPLVSYHLKLIVRDGNVKMEKKGHKKAYTVIEIEEKPFRNCPFCGEDFKMEKTPKFCPYCKEELK